MSVRLSSLALKALLRREGGALADLRLYDTEQHDSLRWILDNPIDGVLELTFTATVELLGETTEVELVRDGAFVAVTDANKQRFVDLKARAIMLHGVRDQLKPT